LSSVKQLYKFVLYHDRKGQKAKTKYIGSKQ